MSKIGIVEGFFGPEWSLSSRKSWASFLSENSGSFYIYAPKRDPHLRKAWRDQWGADYIQYLKDLCDHFHNYDLKFGVGFSPFGLGINLSIEDKNHIIKKTQILKNIGLDYLGLFFDDMPVTDNLLKTQTEVVDIVRNVFDEGLIFCPSFYSYDPILDKVFGNRPKGYVEGLKEAIHPSVDICWTGPKVISEEISEEHLQEVKELLGRRPFIWENIFANDGPRNCKFLKLKNFSGRENFLENVEGVAFNLMNQAELSKILYLSSMKVLKDNLEVNKAFELATKELCGDKLGNLIILNRDKFLLEGLDKIDSDEKKILIDSFSQFDHPFAKEIIGYLSGDYIVGPECLTD